MISCGNFFIVENEKLFKLKEVIINMARNKTKQKELVLEVIKNLKNDFTIKEIYEKLNQNVGLKTI